MLKVGERMARKAAERARHSLRLAPVNVIWLYWHSLLNSPDSLTAFGTVVAFQRLISLNQSQIKIGPTAQKAASDRMSGHKASPT